MYLYIFIHQLQVLCSSETHEPDDIESLWPDDIMMLLKSQSGASIGRFWPMRDRHKDAENIPRVILRIQSNQDILSSKNQSQTSAIFYQMTLVDGHNIFLLITIEDINSFRRS